MTSSSSFKLPLITIGEAGTLAPDQLTLLTQACTDHGFLLLSNAYPRADGSEGHHIAPSKLARMWEVAAELFDATPEAKQAVSVASSNNNRGYFSSMDYAEYNKDPNGVHLKDNKEGFFFGSDTLISPGNRVVPGSEGLLTEVEDYMESARAACVAVMRAIVTTGLLANLPEAERSPDAFVASYLADPVYMLKTLKYPASNGNADAHTDYGCITLLLPGDEGLQVHYADAWHPVPFTHGAFVINFGDLLQAWSGTAIKSTIHRVIYNKPGGQPRYSIPFFMHPSRGSSITCGDQVMDSYSYVLSRFDATYKHRQATTTPADEPVAAA